MPNSTPPVMLDIQSFPSTGSDGYTNTRTSNHKVYSYKYMGGSDNQGNIVETTGAGTQEILLSLTSGRYAITKVKFADDPHHQMSWRPATNTWQVWIVDADASDENAYYAVHVKDNNVEHCTFVCDPRIKNQPE